MTITGTIPSAIANFLKTENESLNGIEIKGTDIDVILTDKGTYTELYAIGMGNGSYEIIEIEDNLNLLPEYEESDIISNDVLKKLFSTVINSSLILSFNPLGKIKYGVIDKARNVADKTKKGVNKVKEAGKWVADIIEPEDAQNWIRKQKGFERAKVGMVQRIGGVTGGYYAVLAGNPKDKKFSVWELYRNGNEYRTLKTDFFDNSQEALKAYNNLAGISDEENDKSTVNTEKEYNGEEVEQNTDDEGWVDAGDGFSYKVTAGLKKKKKKSKYNSCDVTGYEDGTLISPMSVGDGGMAASSLIKNNLELFEQEILQYMLKTEEEQNFIADLQEKMHELQDVNKVIAGEMTKDERRPLATLKINFYKSKTSEVGVVCVNIDKLGVHVDNSTFDGLLNKLDRVIEQLRTNQD